jgi:hypothetical protein
MGVRTLVGEADGATHAAAMYCSTSGWMVGPIFEAPDAEDQIEAFLAWLQAGRWRAWSAETGRRPRIGDGGDPREWDDGELERLVQLWRADHVGEDGWLFDPFLCHCGHHHLGEDGEYTRGEGECADGPRCLCERWNPGNKAAEAAAKED